MNKTTDLQRSQGKVNPLIKVSPLFVVFNLTGIVE